MTAADLVAWRGSLGLTQEEAARTFGLALKTWQRYEGGQRDVPRVLQLACRYLELVRAVRALAKDHAPKERWEIAPWTQEPPPPM